MFFVVAFGFTTGAIVMAGLSQYGHLISPELGTETFRMLFGCLALGEICGAIFFGTKAMNTKA